MSELIQWRTNWQEALEEAKKVEPSFGSGIFHGGVTPLQPVGP